MQLSIIDDHNYLSPADCSLIQDLLQLASQAIGLEEGTWELDLTIVNNEEIHQLNQTYRQVDRPTDVLSFALEETIDPMDHIQLPQGLALPRHLGDIVVSYEMLEAQAQDYQHSRQRELGFLVVHGFLHLNGYDHQTPEEEQIMFDLQERVLRAYGLSR